MRLVSNKVWYRGWGYGPDWITPHKLLSKVQKHVTEGMRLRIRAQLFRPVWLVVMVRVGSRIKRRVRSL